MIEFRTVSFRQKNYKTDVYSAMINTDISMRKTLLILLLLLALISCSVSQSYDKQKTAEQITGKIENFIQTNGRLPLSLGELGLPESEEGPIYYRRLTDSTYEVWYGNGLGESVTYKSAIKNPPKVDECSFAEFSPATVSHFVSSNLKKRVLSEYPKEALEREVSGLISVKILVDGKGKVIRACAFDGDHSLTTASEAAARKWEFIRNVAKGPESYIEAGISFRFLIDSQNSKGTVEFGN